MEKPLNEERKTNTKYKNNLWLSSASQKRNCISRSRVQIPLKSSVFVFLFFSPGLIIYIIYYLFNFIYICHMYLYYKCPTEVYFTGYHDVAVLFIME